MGGEGGGEKASEGAKTRVAPTPIAAPMILTVRSVQQCLVFCYIFNLMNSFSPSITWKVKEGRNLFYLLSYFLFDILKLTQTF